MTRVNAKRWLPEITHWANGGELYVYDPFDGIWNVKLAQTFKTDQTYVIKDKHFEARKAFALGEEVEMYCPSKWVGWVKTHDNMLWNDDWEYRPKPKSKEWYDDIPEG
ncbi:MAG: hypothetical protein J7L15_06340, partial [Clostridiales bacterium]|nr:hypothetical protein [Clostridiales bacterium]